MKLYNILFLVLITGFLFSCGDDDDSESLKGNWVKTTYFDGGNRGYVTALVIEDTVYLIGGYDGKNRLNDVWKFDEAGNFWMPDTTFPGIARTGAVAFAVGNKGYYGTGFDGDNRLKDMWQFDPSKKEKNERWKRLGNDFGGAARYGAVAFAINGKGYIASGNTGSGTSGLEVRDLWEYTPETDTWYAKKQMSANMRTNAVAFVLNNKAYVVSGIISSEFVEDFNMYDPTTDTWTMLKKIANSPDTYDDSYTILRQNACAFTINNKAYITCGDKSSILNDTWEYDPTTDLWTKKSYFEGITRTYATGFTIHNKGYVVCGTSGGSYFRDMWEFRPNEESSSQD
jgi:N-acetylneuraminic acid mutarotase